MNRGLARFIGDVLDLFADNALFFGIVGVLCFLFGPSLLVFLERKKRLPRVVVWLFTFVLTPAMFLFLIFMAIPQGYCNNPLPHDAFRVFYPLFLPLIPLYVHYFRAEHLNHPFLFGFILVALSAGVFTLTIGYEILHLAYQSVQGHGIVYSGARAWECAYVNYGSMYSARDTRDMALNLFVVIQVIALVAVRMRKRRQRLGEEE
ncbi:MAG: hypothetical protein CMB74_05240 [Euryarchaeota archaeon]|nr:hypothetical protein [Euryarchaeota archaeon]